MWRLITSIMIDTKRRWRPSVVGDFLLVVIPLLKHAQLAETCEGTEEVAEVAICLPRQR